MNASHEVGGLPLNQSLERARWAPAVCFAGRQLWRVAQLQIRQLAVQAWLPMPRFQVLVHGKNVILLKDEKRDETHVGGVYVWRVVEVATEGDALDAAVEQLVAEPEFQEEIWNTAQQPPEFEADEVLSLNSDAPLDGSLDTGYMFYAETDD
jgi:hypothetical protein